MKHLILREKGENQSPGVSLLHTKAISMTTADFHLQVPRPGPLELLSTLLLVFRCIQKKKGGDMGSQLTWAISVYSIFALLI